MDSAYGEVVEKSRDDFDCMCHKIKEGLGCFSNRCVNALEGADHEQRRRPLQTPGEYAIPPDDQFSDPSSTRSKIITESVCSADLSSRKPAASSTVAVAKKSSQGFYQHISNDGKKNKRLDGFVDDGDDDGPVHDFVDSSSDDNNNDDEATAVRSMATIR